MNQSKQEVKLEAAHELISEVRELLLRHKQIKEFYGTADAALYLEKAEFTVREWCRLGRINAQKRHSGRGRSTEWVISHAELLRIEKDGLLPLRFKR